jgi:hypothetical protein
MKKVAQEAVSVKRKTNYRTNWMTTEVLENIKLKKRSI